MRVTNLKRFMSLVTIINTPISLQRLTHENGRGTNPLVRGFKLCSRVEMTKISRTPCHIHSVKCVCYSAFTIAIVVLNVYDCRLRLLLKLFVMLIILHDHSSEIGI